MLEFLRTMYSADCFASIAAALSVTASGNCYGWFAPSVNYLLDPKSPNPLTKSEISFLVSSITLTSVVFSIPAGLLSQKVGRKQCILYTGPIFIFCWIILSFIKSYTIDLFVRCLQGVAGGIVLAVVPVYIGEIASASNRGRLTGLFVVSWFLGFLVEYCLGAIFSHKVFTLLSAVIPLVFTIIFAYQPESPYHLVIKGNECNAIDTLKKLRRHTRKDNLERELEEIKTSVKTDLETKFSWKSIIHTSADRRALFILLIVGLTRSYTGNIAFMTFSSNFFSENDSFDVSPNIVTIILGFVTTLSAITSLFFVDSFGRRYLLIISSVGAMFSLTIVGIFFFIKEKTMVDVSFISWIVPLGVTIFIAFIVFGIYPITITYSSELFTNKTRALASSISGANEAIGALVSVQLYTIIGEYFGIFSVFLFFDLICICGGAILYFFAPETKGKTFTEIRAQLVETTENK